MKVFYYHRSNPFTRICEYVPNGDISHLTSDPDIIIIKTHVVR